MRDLLIAQFRPFSQFLILLMIILLTGSLVSYASIELVKLLYGFDLSVDITALSDINEPFVAEANRVLLVCQHLGFFIFPALVFAHFMRTQIFGNYLLWKAPKPSKTWLWGIGAFLLLLPFVNFLAFINEGLELPATFQEAQKLLEDAEAQAQEFVMQLIALPGIGQTIFTLIALAVIPAIGEEFIFRGCIQRMLSRKLNNVHAPVWISALLFSLLHFQFFGFLPRLVLGAGLGYLFLYSKNIWLPILAHFLNNAIAVFSTQALLNTDEKSALDTLGYGLSTNDIIIALSCAALAIYLVYKMSRINTIAFAPQYKWEIL